MHLVCTGGCVAVYWDPVVALLKGPCVFMVFTFPSAWGLLQNGNDTYSLTGIPIIDIEPPPSIPQPARHYTMYLCIYTLSTGCNVTHLPPNLTCNGIIDVVCMWGNGLYLHTVCGEGEGEAGGSCITSLILSGIREISVAIVLLVFIHFPSVRLIHPYVRLSSHLACFRDNSRTTWQILIRLY
jgi:hypothetical protein